MKNVPLIILGFALLLPCMLPARPAPAPVQSVQKLLAHADSLRRADQYADAARVAHLALDIAERESGAEDTTVAHALHILGDCSRHQHKPEEAESYLNRSLAIFERAVGSEHPEVASCLNSLGLLAQEQGNNADAECLLQRTLEIRERVLGPRNPDVAQSLNNLGNQRKFEDRYAEAETFYRQALSINVEALGPEHLTVAMNRNNLSVILEHQGRYAEAEQLLRQALAVRMKANPNHSDLADSFVALALLDEDLGRYADAEPLLIQALTIDERVLSPTDPKIATILNNLGSVYTHEGRFDDAEPLFKRALNILESSGPDQPELVQVVNNLAACYGHQGRYSEAEPFYRRAIAIREKAGLEDADLATLVNNLALIYVNQGRYAEAEPLHKRALSIWQTDDPDNTDVATGLNDLGTLYQDLGRYADAEPLLRQALTIREKALGSDHPDVAESLSGLAIDAMQQGRYADACNQESHAWSIRRINFKDVFAAMAERDALEYSQYLETESANYLSALLDCPNGRTTNSDKLAEVILSCKGQVSDGMLARSRALVNETDRKVLALADSLRLARFVLSKLYVSGQGEDDIETYRAKLADAEKTKERFEAELARHCATFAREQGLWEVKAQKIVSALPPRASLVEFMRYDHRTNSKDSEFRYLALVVRPGANPALFELGKAAEVDSAVAQYRRQLHDPTSLDDQAYSAAAEDVYRTCWQPFANLLTGSAEVFIAPDGELNLVSFAGLKDETGKYLIESYPLHYVSTGRDLIRLKDRPPSGSGLLAMGDPDYGHAYEPASDLRRNCDDLSKLVVANLPGTRIEVEAVAAQWRASRSDPALVFLGPSATEENFKSKAPGKRVLHLATHGFNFSTDCQSQQTGRNAGEEQFSENPMLRCGFLLTGANRHGEGAREANREDGIVTAEDVAALTLQGTDLVVLSACETGLGEVRAGEGVYGLRRAFQMAGARTVISALWSVDDKATAALMSQLFSSDTESIPQAMRQAALRQIHDFRAAGKSDHPFFWAAFIATGDWKMQ